MAVSELHPQLDRDPRASTGLPDRTHEEPLSLFSLAAGLVAAAASWYLLKELGPLLRPLVLAIFLAYLVVPIHHRLRRHVSATVSATVIVAGTLLVLCGLAMIVYGGLVELNADLPRLIDRVGGAVEGARSYGRDHLPRGLLDSGPA